MDPKSPIILALDTTEIQRVEFLINETKPYISVYKFGLEFYLKHGLETLRDLKRRFGFELFLDLKLHDIPNTVRKAALSLADLEPMFLTVHASGGREMIAEASSALPDSKIAAVTILTSLDQEALTSMGIRSELTLLVLELATEAVRGGARAIVASPHEVSSLKGVLPGTIMITPGIRSTGDSLGDQNRVMSARDALDQGSDYLVIGRPISEQVSPRDAARAILKSLN